jgi:hypothetical protein
MVTDNYKTKYLNKKMLIILMIIFSFLLLDITSNYGINPEMKDKGIPFRQESSVNINQIGKTRILIDISHGWEVFIPGKISPMGAILEATGKYEVIDLFKQEINDSILTDIDILMITTPDPNLPYKSSEIQAVSKYWSEGGSLMFVGSYQGLGFESYRPNSEVNRVISSLGFNISFSEDRTIHARGENSHALPDHPLTYGIKNTYFYDGCPIVIGDEPEAAVISDRSDNPNYVAWDNSTHRAVFLGGVDPLFEFDSKTVNLDSNAYNYTHHYQFQTNIFHWLSYRSPEIIQDYRPIRMYTGNQNQISSAKLRQLPYYKGVAHFHTQVSKIAATNQQIASRSVELGYQFIVVTDYNDVSGGPLFNQTITSGSYKVNGRLIQILNGVEVTGLGQYHTTGWGLTQDIAGVLNPLERIELFHAQGSPCILAHPSWLICPPPYERIWDHTLYPFDGYEIFNSGFIQGNGNLVYTGKPWYGGPDDSGGSWNKTWMYVFTDDISSDPSWWNEAFEEKRIVIYNPKDDVYFGDNNLVDELLGRMNDLDKPIIIRNSPDSFTPEEEVIIDITVDDASPATVELTVNGIKKDNLIADLSEVGRFSTNLGKYADGINLEISLKVTDSLDYQSTMTYTIAIDTQETTTTTNNTTSVSLWFVVLSLIILTSKSRKKR